MACQVSHAVGIAQFALLCLVSAAAAQGQANCNVPGFTFRQGQVPNQKQPGAHVGLFSLPYKPQNEAAGSVPPTPYPNLAATGAACQADPKCAIFTSDGYIIAAFRAETGFPNEDRRAMPEADALDWKQMLYCAQPCCGTWVADGALQQVLAALPASASAAASGQGAVRAVAGGRNIPRDWIAITSMDPTLIDTACAGKEYQLRFLATGEKVGRFPADCPQRCRVACCKQLAQGNKRGDHEDEYRLMAWHHFGQCSASVCSPCGFAQGMVAANSQGNILMRQYLRAKAAEAAGAPSEPQQSKTG